jgi:MFS family permease
MTVSWLADKYRVRGLPVICQGLFGIIGLCMTGFLNAPVPRYIGTFLGYAGAIGLVVTSMSWMANNLRGDGKRAIATAVMISVSGVGGIYSSLVFRQQVRILSLPLGCVTKKANWLILGCPQLHSRTCCGDGR